MDLNIVDVVARWFHFLGVVVWMGHNYANVIQNPLFKPAGPDASSEELGQRFEAAMKREHAIFRHASLVVLVTGAFMLWHRDMLWDVVALQGGNAVLGVGVWLGLIMVANLWFVLWPHQKKVLGFIPATLDERVRCSRITFLSSRTNTILSFPALFFMAAGAHSNFLFG
jgi:uncharacterized membrane protein